MHRKGVYAFGGMFAGVLAPYSSMGITGKEYDAKSGLMWYNSRWYSPETGRFTQPDTFKGYAASPGTQHPYAYVGNNPVNRIDPTGHAWVTIWDALCPYDIWVDDPIEGDEDDNSGNDDNDSGSDSGGSDDGGYTGGGSDSSGGGGTYEPPAPTKAQRSATFNSSAPEVTATVTVNREVSTNKSVKNTKNGTTSIPKPSDAVKAVIGKSQKSGDKKALGLTDKVYAAAKTASQWSDKNISGNLNRYLVEPFNIFVK